MHDRSQTAPCAAYRSSAITLPSFGSAPGLTSSTAPPSFVTARKVPAISSRSVSLAVAVSTRDFVASVSPWRGRVNPSIDHVWELYVLGATHLQDVRAQARCISLIEMHL
jgi:hypothetical protein